MRGKKPFFDKKTPKTVFIAENIKSFLLSILILSAGRKKVNTVFAAM